jgi:hypothetical protein
MKLKVYHIVLIVLVLVSGAYFIGNKFNKEIVYRQVEKEVILDNLTSKVNQLKGELVSTLKQCESGGAKESDGLVTFDPHPTNKKVQIASFGQFQFKKSTVIFYYKELYNKDITGLEAINIALSEQKASQLATDIIFKEQALNNWYNCTKKHNLQSRLDVINTLTK